MPRVSDKELKKIGEEEGFDLERFEEEMSGYDEPDDDQADKADFARQVEQSFLDLSYQAEHDPSARQIFEKISNPELNVISEDPEVEYDALRSKGFSDTEINTCQQDNYLSEEELRKDNEFYDEAMERSENVQRLVGRVGEILAAEPTFQAETQVEQIISLSNFEDNIQNVPEISGYIQ